jgi:hypothetical protein
MVVIHFEICWIHARFLGSDVVKVVVLVPRGNWVVLPVGVEIFLYQHRKIRAGRRKHFRSYRNFVDEGCVQSDRVFGRSHELGDFRFARVVDVEGTRIPHWFERVVFGASVGTSLGVVSVPLCTECVHSLHSFSIVLR